MIAFFPGKFQPPHLGHITTVMRIYDDYDRILVCITEDVPQVIHTNKVKKIFEEVFQHLPKVKVVLIKGALYSRSNTEGLPMFDVLVTGNPDIVQWAEKHNVPCRFMNRSDGPGFSGAIIRKGLN